MPQNPIGLYAQPLGGTASKPLLVDPTTGLLLTADSPTGSALNITAATVVKAAPGRVLNVSVLVAGSTVGTINDCLTTGAVAAANEVMAIPDTVGVYSPKFPCFTGIVVVPGTGQTLAVAYS